MLENHITECLRYQHDPIFRRVPINKEHPLHPHGNRLSFDTHTHTHTPHRLRTVNEAALQ